jgi:hypothetical protein
MKNILVLIAVLCSFTFAQYNEGNTVVTWVKYKWEPMTEVEGGSWQEREDITKEYHTKRNAASKILKGKMLLTHYWTGSVLDVHLLSEFKDMNDATKHSSMNAEINRVAWSDEEERRTTLTTFGKYNQSYHEDLHILENHTQLEKVLSGGYPKNTFVSVNVRYWKPLSMVENGSADERYSLMKKFQKEVVGKNPKILSQKVLTHLWSGKLEGGYYPLVFVSEYASMEDVDSAGMENGPLAEKVMTESERKRLNEYWMPATVMHEDWGLFRGFTPANK